MWIESHQELGDHPKTRKLARLLGVSRPAIVGHMHYLWWWAANYADDGDLTRFDALDIATGAEWEGDETAFLDSLIAAGFLDRDDAGTITIHDWHEYAGKLIERRRANAQRMREARATQDAPPKTERAAHVQRTNKTRENHVNACVERPNRTKPNTTKPTKDTPPPPSDISADVPTTARAPNQSHQVFQVFCELTNTDEATVPAATRAAQHGIAKNLLGKYEFGDIEGCMRWLASWRTKPWTLELVWKEIDEWILSKRPKDGKWQPPPKPTPIRSPPSSSGVVGRGQGEQQKAIIGRR